MSEIIHLIVAFSASIVGALSGIGGGIIIKPTLDAIGFFEISTITFLSGCTVLSMSGFSILLNRKKNVSINIKIAGVLSAGSVIGGVTGKYFFNLYLQNTQSPEKIQILQSVILLLLTFGVLIINKNKKKLKPIKIDNFFLCIAMGFFLGITGSFLGIGGGPINLLVLYFFFSMKPKEAAINSLFIIFFSQLSGLLLTFFMDKIPYFPFSILLLMILGGISGALTGSVISKRISESDVENFYNIVLLLIIGLCLKNIFL